MSSLPLPPIVVTRKTGLEPLHTNGQALRFKLADFWAWSTSDIVSNATRGILTEFIVATALGVDVTGVRNEWNSFDLTTPSGVKVEVKSAAYLQSWYQKRLSIIQWLTRPTHGWINATGEYEAQSRRQADVYVFALLHHQDKATIDPLDTTQWSFFVVPTRVLDARTRSQHSIALNSLRALAGPPLTYSELSAGVEEAGWRQRGGA